LNSRSGVPVVARAGGPSDDRPLRAESAAAGRAGTAREMVTASTAQLEARAEEPRVDTGPRFRAVQAGWAWLSTDWVALSVLSRSRDLAGVDLSALTLDSTDITRITSDLAADLPVGSSPAMFSAPVDRALLSFDRRPGDGWRPGSSDGTRPIGGSQSLDMSLQCRYAGGVHMTPKKLTNFRIDSELLEGLETIRDAKRGRYRGKCEKQSKKLAAEEWRQGEGGSEACENTPRSLNPTP